MLRSIGKQSGESMELVMKKKRKAMVGRICRKGRFQGCNERLKGWWMTKSGESMEPMGEVCGWRSEAGSWFQRRGEAYWKERSVIRREDDVDGRASATKDEEWVLRGGWTVMSLASRETVGWEWCDWIWGLWQQHVQECSASVGAGWSEQNLANGT